VTAPATNPLSYNAYIQNVAAMAVVTAAETGGVYAFVDAPLAEITGMMLNYAELRIQRDLDFLSSQATNPYTLTAGSNLLSVPINDFVTVTNVQSAQLDGNGNVVNTCPMTPTSREFIQNCYGGLVNAGTPKFFAMVGDTFGDGGNTSNNILFGPYPNYPYSVLVTGTIRLPSLATYATAGPADTAYTTISQWFPDMLLMASMIYISAFQRNFSATSDSPDMGQSYEKQYQALRLGAIAEENRKKQLGSAYTAYSTPVSATPTR
jgi:hypothetical protein